MIVCSCAEVRDSDLPALIKEAPTLPQDPYSLDYKTDLEQIVEYIYDERDITEPCMQCHIFLTDFVSKLIPSCRV